MKLLVLATAACALSQATGHCFTKCSSRDVACLGACFSMASPADVLAAPVIDCEAHCSADALDSVICPPECLKDDTALHNATTIPHAANTTAKAAGVAKSAPLVANSTESSSIVVPTNYTQNATSHPTPRVSPQVNIDDYVSGAALPTALPALAACLALAIVA